MKKRGGGGSRQVTVLDVAQCNYLNPGQINGIHHGALKKFHRCWVPLQQPFELQIRFFPVQSYRHNAKTITATDLFWIFFSFAFFLSFFFLFIIFSVYTSLVHKVLEKKTHSEQHWSGHRRIDEGWNDIFLRSHKFTNCLHISQLYPLIPISVGL